MRKLGRTAAVILALTAVLSGCSQGRKLNDLTVVQAAAFDVENGVYTVTVQYLDLNKGTGKNEGLGSSLTANAQGRGKTLDEACKNLSDTVCDSLFFGQAKLLVIGRDFMKNDENTLFETLKNSSDFRVDMLLAKSERGYAVLECPFRNERVPIDGICKLLKRKNRLVTVNDYIANRDVSLPEAVINGGSGYVK